MALPVHLDYEEVRDNNLDGWYPDVFCRVPGCDWRYGADWSELGSDDYGADWEALHPDHGVQAPASAAGPSPARPDTTTTPTTRGPQ